MSLPEEIKMTIFEYCDNPKDASMGLKMDRQYLLEELLSLEPNLDLAQLVHQAQQRKQRREQLSKHSIYSLFMRILEEDPEHFTMHHEGDRYVVSTSDIGILDGYDAKIRDISDPTFVVLILTYPSDDDLVNILCEMDFVFRPLEFSTHESFDCYYEYIGRNHVDE